MNAALRAVALTQSDPFGVIFWNGANGANGWLGLLFFFCEAVRDVTRQLHQIN